MSDRRLDDRLYQDWAIEHERRRKELERQGVDPREAGLRVLSEMGEFRVDYGSALREPETRTGG